MPAVHATIVVVLVVRVLYMWIGNPDFSLLVVLLNEQAGR